MVFFCFPTNGKFKYVQKSSDGKVVSCLFCAASVQNGFDLIAENNEFVAFRDHKPAAEHHILIVSKMHIESVKSFTPSDKAYVQAMEKLGKSVLDDLEVPGSLRKFGFHIPPFNSINHLHMHALGLPYRSPMQEAKYLVAHGSRKRSKGWGWFVETQQVVKILESGGRVRVMPC